VTPGSESESVAATTVTVVTGQRFEIRGSPEKVEATIVGASRGSIMQLAWFTEAASGRSIAINPLHVVALEAVEGPAPAA
jgi:glutamate dehydrogenase/leucine dehydrogenase